MNERQGLVGAMPVGARWRAQGYVGGVTKYLGTFDTEEEAHQVFIRARDAVDAEKREEAEAEIDRILSGPTFEYKGGVGRGAAHNGRTFKIVEARGPHQSVVVPVTTDGIPDFTGQTTVTSAYLYEVRETVVAKAEAVTVDPTPRVGTPAEPPETVSELHDAVRRFVNRPVGTDVPWAYSFAKRHDTPKTSAFFTGISGEGGIQFQLKWLKAHTTVPADIVDAVERETLRGLYLNEEACASARALKKAFPESVSANSTTGFKDADFVEFSLEDIG